MNKLKGIFCFCAGFLFFSGCSTADDENVDTKKELEKFTDQRAHYGQVRLGYSTLSAFRRKEFAIPLMVSVEYRKQYFSKNMPVTDFTQLDLNVFF